MKAEEPNRFVLSSEQLNILLVQARIDELEHTLPFGKDSKLYQERVKELRAEVGQSDTEEGQE